MIVLYFYISYVFIFQATCDGGPKAEIEECCTEDDPCSLGQGDCDGYDECKDDLVCGKNNCGPKFLWSGADCCEEPPGKANTVIVLNCIEFREKDVP